MLVISSEKNKYNNSVFCSVNDSKIVCGFSKTEALGEDLPAASGSEVAADLCD